MTSLKQRAKSPIGLLVLAGAAVAAFSLLSPHTAEPAPPEPAPEPPPTPLAQTSVAPSQPSAEPLSEALRGKGFHECNPHDPIGLGPYSPYRKLRMGRIAIPQRGGHTPDYGYDVLMHFHGHEPLRKTLVQVARGVTYVGIDRGVGSGPYTAAFSDPKRFPKLLASITRNLREHSGQPKAHIRHLALSAWSAGYGAVNRILKHKPEGVDAVVLLDGLHAAWKPGAAHHSKPSDVDPLFIRPIFDFAARAKRGQGIFYLTHSQVEPEGGYPSVKLTTATLLEELGLNLEPVEPTQADEFGLIGRATSGGLHVLSYAGNREYAHCSHLSHIRGALNVIETLWKTPALDRGVPNTPAPQLGAAEPGEADDADEDEDADDADDPGLDDEAPSAASAPDAGTPDTDFVPGPPAPTASAKAAAGVAAQPASSAKPAPTPADQ